MARADLLALELMIHLGECYQQQLSARQSATEQRPDAAGEAANEAP